MKHLLELLNTNNLSELKLELSNQNPVDIAEFLEELDPDKMILVFRILPKDISADVFSYMTSEQQQHVIERISDAEVEFILNDLFLDDTVDFLEEVPAVVVKKVLKNVDENTRKLINTFLQYTPNSAGSIMTVEFLDLKCNFTVQQAIDYIRYIGWEKETIYTGFVINEQRKLLGTIQLIKLLMSNPDTLVKEIMDENIVSVTTQDDQEYVADTVRKYDLISLPVVDNEKRLVGIITYDDVMDVIEEENTEDIEKMAALAPSEEPYLKTSVIKLAKNRIVWLLILMISSTVTAMIIQGFEDVLAAVMILTSFIPMLTDTGGNAGSQAATLVIRGIALGEITSKNVYTIIWKELRVSTLCGFILAIVNFIRMFVFMRTSFVISLAVCISIFLTVIVAKVVGSTLPLVAKKLKFDPALMASPMITTIVDALALFIYFLTVKAFLNI